MICCYHSPHVRVAPLLYSIIFRGILKKVTFLDLRDITNKYLVASLYDLMKYHPICFTVLDESISVSILIETNDQGKINSQTSMSSGEHAG